MKRLARLVVVLVGLAALAGCSDSSSAKPPATDPESIKQLEDLQKQASQGERQKK
jgi:hypothetical protein